MIDYDRVLPQTQQSSKFGLFIAMIILFAPTQKSQEGPDMAKNHVFLTLCLKELNNQLYLLSLFLIAPLILNKSFYHIKACVFVFTTRV